MHAHHESHADKPHTPRVLNRSYYTSSESELSVQDARKSCQYRMRANTSERRGSTTGASCPPTCAATGAASSASIAASTGLYSACTSRTIWCGLGIPMCPNRSVVNTREQSHVACIRCRASTQQAWPGSCPESACATGATTHHMPSHRCGGALSARAGRRQRARRARCRGAGAAQGRRLRERGAPACGPARAEMRCSPASGCGSWTRTRGSPCGTWHGPRQPRSPPFIARLPRSNRSRTFPARRPGQARRARAHAWPRLLARATRAAAAGRAATAPWVRRSCKQAAGPGAHASRMQAWLPVGCAALRCIPLSKTQP